MTKLKPRSLLEIVPSPLKLRHRPRIQDQGPKTGRKANPKLLLKSPTTPSWNVFSVPNPSRGSRVWSTMQRSVQQFEVWNPRWNAKSALKSFRQASTLSMKPGANRIFQLHSIQIIANVRFAWSVFYTRIFTSTWQIVWNTWKSPPSSPGKLV